MMIGDAYTDQLKLLQEAVKDYYEFIFSDEYTEDRLEDYQHDIFEKAVELFYGKNVWKEINKRI